MILRLAALVCASVMLIQADWTDKVTINGYFSFEYEDQVDGDETSQADKYGSFDSDIFNLVFNVQATDRLRLASDLTWEHGPQTETGKGNVGTEYAFAEYTFEPYLKVRTGKMFTPFGIYNELHTAKNTTIIMKEPNPTNKIYFLSPDGSYEQTMLYPRWANGIAVLGDFHMGEIPADYIIQVANGEVQYPIEENEFDHDDNPYKGIAMRIRADITEDFQIGASLYHDKMNDYNFTTEDPMGIKELMTYGVQMIWYVTDAFRMEVEGVYGNLDVTGANEVSFNRFGLSILPSYMVTDRLTLYFLYTLGEPNDTLSQDRVVSYEPGINYELDHGLHLKAELYNVQSQVNTRMSGADYTEFRAAVAIGF